MDWIGRNCWCGDTRISNANILPMTFFLRDSHLHLYIVSCLTKIPVLLTDVRTYVVRAAQQTTRLDSRPRM